jgi:hypothetical protein
MEKHSDSLIKHIKDWHVDTPNPHAVSRKLEELL